ncbi:uncharacterized protein LOC124444728 isoform X1 [Xenia sp. Carnegie-2017]|uniref:uncharacterized protein LOC124444728 isoform X1 n=2 Tax=Xenia sp. Carnegie-2017 TaxID=2897299 RepID=UPI001F03CF35|nr:uncharacterized protein LOC124444728 isoform X1 [Xenia sp. Carnegie-2017]
MILSSTKRSLCRCSIQQRLVSLDVVQTPCIRSLEMARHEDDILIIRENPNTDHYDVVWKPRRNFPSKDYLPRRKPPKIENTFKSVNDATGKNKNVRKDEAIDYSYIDEYCKVSGAIKPEDDTSRPGELKTNTTAEFGRQKVSFEKFLKQTIGGVNSSEHDTLTVQPTVGDNRKCQKVQSSNTYRNVREYDENSLLQDYCLEEDVSLNCCGCNVETTVDVCTCMWCVKGVFYHCTKDSDDVLDHPCSCSPVNVGCCTRWGIMGLLSLLFPCLLCYPGAKICTGVCRSYKEGEMKRKQRRNRTTQHQRAER